VTIYLVIISVNSLLTTSWNEGSNHFSNSRSLFQNSLIWPCSKQVLIIHNYPVHSLWTRYGVFAATALVVGAIIIYQKPIGNILTNPAQDTTDIEATNKTNPNPREYIYSYESLLGR
jgi:hypothetical protein